MPNLVESLPGVRVRFPNLWKRRMKNQMIENCKGDCREVRALAAAVIPGIRARARRLGRELSRLIAETAEGVVDFDDMRTTLEAVRALPGGDRITGRAALLEKCEAFICDDCGAIEPAGTEHGTGGGHEVCDSCYESYSTCENCGCHVLLDDAQSSPDGETYCDDCYRESFASCSTCGETFSRDDMHGVRGLRGLHCSDCCDEHYHYDDDAGEYSSRPPAPKLRANQGPSERDSKIWQWLRGFSQAGEIIECSLPNNGIAHTGIERVAAELFADNTTRRRMFNEWIYAERSKNGAELTEWANKSGTLPKRIARWVKATFGEKLDCAALGKIGDLARTYCPKESAFRYKVVGGEANGDWLDWGSCDYGQSCSCWWSVYSGARRQLESQHNGFALLFYDRDGVGVGRVWVLVLGGVAYLFNVYGPHSLLSVARMLSFQCAGLYHVCDHFSWPGAFINSSCAYGVGYCSDTEFKTRVDVSIVCTEMGD
jgi:hypothetical protein